MSDRGSPLVSDPGSTSGTPQAVATRYDKRDYTFRGTIDLASIRIWLRDPVP